MKGPKWLDSISLVPNVEPGYWEDQGWDQEAVVRTTARFDVPVDGTLLRAQAPAVLAGVAFAGVRGVQAVEWSSDGGSKWNPAHLEPPLSPLTWVLWRATWTPHTQGGFSLVVRARDGTGQLQTSEEMPSYPGGATGYHRITVAVGAA